MHKISHNLSLSEKRKQRVRSKIHGSAQRPRVSVYRSNKHVFLQAIDDDAQVTIASVHDKTVKSKQGMTKTMRAEAVAVSLAKQLQSKKVKQVVFDRGSYRYHGRVKVVAQALRDAGMEV